VLCEDDVGEDDVGEDDVDVDDVGEDDVGVFYIHSNVEAYLLTSVKNSNHMGIFH
jgi:hypothetical protein